MDADKAFDELLVIQTLDGDKEAFELLVKRWHKKLISFSFKFGHDADLAQDIVQESWVTIYQQLSKLNDLSKFKSWAYRIVYNKTMDQLKVRQKELEFKSTTDKSEVEEVTTELPDVNKMIQQLPQQQRTILTLFYLDEMSVEAIAEILNLPKGTVKSRLFYAREKLKETIKASSYENYR